MIWQFLAHVVMLACCFYALRGLGKPKFRLVREELRLGLFFSIPFILKAARQNADLLVLSLVTSAEVMSSYSVARRIIESSYLSVDALNRIVYPGTAKASQAGLHHASERVKRIFAAAMAISIASAIAVWILSPVLPYLFGHQYTSLVDFVRALCFVLIPVAYGRSPSRRWALPAIRRARLRARHRQPDRRSPCRLGHMVCPPHRHLRFLLCDRDRDGGCRLGGLSQMGSQGSRPGRAGRTCRKCLCNSLFPGPVKGRETKMRHAVNIIFIATS